MVKEAQVKFDLTAEEQELMIQLVKKAEQDKKEEE